MDNSVLVRNEKANHIAHEVSSTVAEGIKGGELIEWHQLVLKNIYLSSRDHIDCNLIATRGWDTNIRIDVSSNADESKDRLTDYLINNVKQCVRDNVKRATEIEFEDLEKIKTLRINRTVNTDEKFDPQYTVEFETEKFDSPIVQDHKMDGHPRIAGRRVLVSWIWSNHVRRELSPDEIQDLYDGTVTLEEIESAIEYAIESDKFQSREEIEQEESEELEFATLEDLENAIGDLETSDIPDVEDNRNK